MDSIHNPVWIRKPKMTFGSALTLQSGLICISTADDAALIIDPVDGRTVSQIPMPGSVRSLTLTPLGDLLVVSNSGHPDWISHIFIIDQEMFQTKVTYVDRPVHYILTADDVHAFGTTSVHGDIRRDLVALSLNNGSVAWTVDDIGSKSAATLHEGVLYLTTEKSPALRAYNAANGAAIWSDESALQGGPILIEGTRLFVAVGDGELNNQIVCYDIATQERTWTARTPGIATGILYYDKSIFVTSAIKLQGSDVIAQMTEFDALTGERKIHLSHGNRRMGQLGAAHGLIFVPMVERGLDDKPGGGLLCLRRHDGTEVFRSYFDWTRGIFAIPLDNAVLFSTHSQVGLFELKTLWSITLESSARVKPAAQNNAIVVGTSSGDVINIDARDGRVVWRIDGKSPAKAAATIYANTAYAAIGDEIVAVDLASGTVNWRSNLGSPITGYINIRNVGEKFVAVGSEDGSVFVLNADTGHRVTAFDIGAAAAVPIFLGDSHLIIGGNDGKLSSYSYDGDLIWDVEGIHELRSLLVRPGTILVVDAGGSVRAHSFSDGSEIWRTRLDDEVDASGLVAGRGGLFFVVDALGVVAAVDYTQGAIAWRSAPTGIGSRLPAVVASFLVLVSNEGKVTVLNQHDGSVSRVFELNRTIVSEIGRTADYLVVADDRGLLHRLIV